MRILFVTAHSFLPERVSGAEFSMHWLLRALADRGLAVALLCKTAREPESGGGFPSLDHSFGYSCYRAPDPALAAAEVARAFAPEVAVAQTGSLRAIVETLSRLPLPTVVYFRDAQFVDFHFLQAAPGLTFLANSRFVQARARDLLGLDCHYVPSLIAVERYVTESARSHVLFIGCHPYKGFEIALRLAAARPALPFIFAQSWPLTPETRDFLKRRAEALDNVTWSPPLRDARKLYAKARLLLVPSVWEESAPRVVVEAQASGIPVLASDRGGLSEWVGAGGVVLPLGPDDAAWLEALDRLWHDEAFYEGLSHAARARARRADLEEEQVLARFLAALDVALKPAGGGSGR